jgi:hypothetical protein
VNSWNTFVAQMSHGQTRTHKTHHGPNLGETTTFPLILFFVFGHGNITQMSFCPKIPKLGIPKFPKLGFPRFWGRITCCADLRLRWGLKKGCIPCFKNSNNMWHATCMQVNWGDSWLLMDASQIDNLTPDPYFGHNLCFKYPNGSCEPILDIYVSRSFQWYK